MRTAVKRSAIFIAILSMIFAAISAAGAAPRFVDGASLLSESDAASLTKKLDEISERAKMDVVIITLQSLEGKRSQAAADDIFDYDGYGWGSEDDGILFLISMSEREWAISTHARGIRSYTDRVQEIIMGEVGPLLSEGRYNSAFTRFAELCDDYSDGKGPFPLAINLIVGLVIGLIVAFVAVGSMKAQLKSVRRQESAADYTRPGSFSLSNSQDLFLYSTVTRTKRQKSSGRSGSSTHTSSSGRTHGGSSGRF